MTVNGERGLGWAVTLRRKPVRIIEGQPTGGYTDMFEIICCECGDHPYLDYSEVSPRLQQTRGPYPMRAGVGAYEQHVNQHLARLETRPLRLN